MKAMVQLSGISAPTLRAWERRYAILSPERAQNDYRLYSWRDVAIIQWLKERVDAGMSISQAIALFRHFEADEQAKQDVSPKARYNEQELASTRIELLFMVAPQPYFFATHS